MIILHFAQFVKRNAVFRVQRTVCIQSGPQQNAPKQFQRIASGHRLRIEIVPAGHYSIVSTFRRLVVPETPSGTPAVMTTRSPGSV